MRENVYTRVISRDFYVYRDGIVFSLFLLRMVIGRHAVGTRREGSIIS